MFDAARNLVTTNFQNHGHATSVPGWQMLNRPTFANCDGYVNGFSKDLNIIWMS